MGRSIVVMLPIIAVISVAGCLSTPPADGSLATPSPDSQRGQASDKAAAPAAVMPTATSTVRHEQSSNSQRPALRLEATSTATAQAPRKKEPTAAARAVATKEPTTTARAVVAKEPTATPALPRAQVDADRSQYAYCGIPNFAWTDRGALARGGQPSPESLRCLRDAGFKAVVNLRAEHDERSIVEQLGMRYLRLNVVDDTTPSPQQLNELLAFIDSRRKAGEAVFVHCAGGRGRTGVAEGVFLLWKGWSADDVIDRFIRMGAKIPCEKAGNGQLQALHEIGLLRGRGDAWPAGSDNYGNPWQSCARPGYMAGWDYSLVAFPSSDAD